jgi:SAM-dependent methyltransferase
MDQTDPNQAGFWQKHYESGQTPWDFGGVPSDLKAYLKRRPKGGRALIPGCGSGYDVQAFVEAGYDVTALDLAPAAIQLARERVGAGHADCVMEGDFFQSILPAASFDVIYERTFLTAITPDRRTDYRNRMTQLLKHGGALIGYFYYQKTDPKDGPPFGLAWGEGDVLFGRHFILTKDVAVADSLPLFVGRERWQERRRTAYVESAATPPK